MSPRGTRYLLDTNVLVYALQEESPQHAASRGWLTNALAASKNLAATSAALAGLVRLVTNPRLFNKPTAEGAFIFVDQLLDAGLQVSEPTPGHWPIFRSLCLRHGLAGNDIPDAHLAAVAIEHDATLVTHDRGFDRFPELRTLDPIAAGD